MTEQDNVRKKNVYVYIDIYVCVHNWVTLLYSKKLTESCKPNYNGKNKNHYKKKLQM